MSAPDPYLSFVVVARNDNYGGDFLARMQVFLNGLLTLCDRHGLTSELVIVEWNPPDDRDRLRDALTWPKCRTPHTVRIIEVPAEMHQRLPNSDRMPVFEYIAKNVGIRRAKGEYVLATNPDLLYSQALIGFLASGALSPHCFYRVNRYDVNAAVPPVHDVETQLTFCAQHVFKAHFRGFSIDVHYPAGPFGRLRLTLRALLHHLRNYGRGESRVEDQIHTNASGDFLLMHREAWYALQGYPELPTSSHIDGYMCVMAASGGMRQIVLRGRRRIYHQEHERAVNWTNPEDSDRPVTSYELWTQRCEEMLRDQKPRLFNADGWGLGAAKLSEDVID